MESTTTATLITTTTIFSTFLGVSGNNNGFAYNVEMDEQMITSQTVYKKSENDKHLSHHLKYNYTYDEQKRLTRKEAMKWNGISNQWEHSHCLYYVYDQSGFSIEYALWNPQKAGYTEILSKQVYDQSLEGTMAVTLYKWDKADNDWVMQDNVIMMNPDSNLLTAF